MLKAELMEALKVTKQCLSTQNLLPILNHFCFTKDALLSFNGTQGISYALSSDLNCAVPGDLFYKLVESLNYEEINIINSKDNIALKAGSFSSKLATLSRENFAFSIPNLPSTKIEFDADFIKGVEKCLLSVGNKPNMPAQYGVTITSEALYSTDNIRISKFTLKTPIPGNIKSILPKNFCQLLVYFFKESTGALYFSNDFIIAISGKITLFTKVPIDVKFLDFEKVIAATCNTSLMTQQVPVTLEQALNRCLIVTASSVDKIIKMRCGEKKIEVEAVLERVDGAEEAQLLEDVLILTPINLIEFKVDVSYLKELITNVKNMGFYKGTNKVVVVGQDENYLHLLCSLPLV